MRTLPRRADNPAFLVVVTAVAVAATLSMSVPFAGLLVAAVLYLIFHHLGWAKLFAAYPNFVRSIAWRDATRWLAHHGVVALLVVAATPLPQTPALMFAAISRLPIVEVVLALWIGKLAKHLMYAWLVSRFPERALRRGQRHAEALRVIVARAMSTTAALRDDTTSSGELR